MRKAEPSGSAFFFRYWMAQTMTEENHKEKTEDLQIRLPEILAKRVRNFASENDTSITGVMIEALDIFLREHNKQNDR